MSAARTSLRHHQSLPQDTDLDLGAGGSYTSVITLSLSDLVPDRTGSIVIQTGGDTLLIELNGYEEVLKRGIAADGTQSEHFDVSGLDFIKFLNGSTLYFAAEEVHLVLSTERYPTPRQTGTVRSLAAAIERELSGRAARGYAPSSTGRLTNRR